MRAALVGPRPLGCGEDGVSLCGQVFRGRATSGVAAPCPPLATRQLSPRLLGFVTQRGPCQHGASFHRR